jgi:hypothetical protein
MRRAKFKATYDTDYTVPLQGNAFLHCGKCLKEQPVGTTPREWARQQLAITPEGHFQLWCTRHDCNIALIKIEAQ